MADNSKRGTGIYVVLFLLIALVAANAFALSRLAMPGATEVLTATWSQVEAKQAGEALRTAQSGGILPWIAILIASPFVLAIVLLFASRPRRAAVVAEADVAGEDAKPSEEPLPGAAGLRLLAALQEEARLVDFVREDLDSYSDEQVGAAVRGVHAALRKAVDDRLTLLPILAGEDGDGVEVPEGFEPAQIRLLGNPVGGPPYKGILRHAGWRATEVRLPRATAGSDPTILAPAEVEVAGE